MSKVFSSENLRVFIGLLCADVDFLPLLALLVVVPLLLLAIGVTLVHRPVRRPAS